jgi:hypothetical protein
VKHGLQRLTGLEARVAPGKIELAYDDEHDLEELAEALEPPLTVSGLHGRRCIGVTPVRPDDLEALETVSQNVPARDLFLRVAHLCGAGQLNRFLFELEESDELDAETKAVFVEVAQRTRSFLTALDDYVHCTRVFH